MEEPAEANAIPREKRERKKGTNRGWEGKEGPEIATETYTS